MKICILILATLLIMLLTLPGVEWEADSSDNVCGVSDARQVTNPLVVEYDVVLNEAPSYKKITKNNIDINSAEGIILLAAAKGEVKKSCKTVQLAENGCSVWKKIVHKAGLKTAKNITSSVKDELLKL